MIPTKAREARARKHADIKRAAIEEFARHGFQGASTQAIAARAGLSKPQLNYYIDSKLDLYREVLLDTMNAWGESFGFEDEELGPESVLTSYIRKKLEFSFSDPLRTKIFTTEILAGAPVFASFMPMFRRRTVAAAAMLQRWMDAGLMRRLDSLQLLMNIWAITQSYADYEQQVRYFMRKKALSAADREHIIEHVTRLILAGCSLAEPPNPREPTPKSRRTAPAQGADGQRTHRARTHTKKL